MSDEERAKRYFDFGEISEEIKDGSLDDPFDVLSMAVATRQDVENGRSNSHFDLMMEGGTFAQISGIRSFIQNTIVRIIDEAESFSANGMNSREMATLEGETRQIALDDTRVSKVNDVTVEDSSREYENEIKISMNLETDYARYDAECFIGDQSALDAS